MYDNVQEGSPHRHVPGPAPDAPVVGPNYAPVSCDFTDALEELSIRRQYVDVAHWGENAELLRSTGRIVDIFTTPGKEEYLKLNDGVIVRLDRIQEVKSHRPRDKERAA